ncbi:MAG: T9SS type A sorting domain-containing protein [Bacteroidales bacterium]|nr:T9SS type A sorting domain-containing protein [Bacteroidales bacterium]
MKKPFLLSILFLSLVFQVASQNYQTVNSDRVASFQYNGDHGFVRIDSVAYDTDSILIPFRNIQDVDYWCYTINGAHWLGDKIIIREDGFNIFLNRDGDSIYINTAASLNDSWTTFHRQGELSIISTVINHDTMSFLGLQDSVKTIGFQVYNELMNPMNHLINNYTIKLSKNYGFVRTLNYTIFSDLLPTSYPPVQFENLVEFDISGLSDPVTGIQDFTWMDIYDFQPGDEIHVKRYWSQTMQETDIQLLILRYLERTDYPDSIVYHAERIFSRDYKNQGNYTFTFIHDTIPEIIHPNPIFDKLPGEVGIDTITYGSELIAYSLKMYSGTHLAKIIPEENYWFFNYGDTCWHTAIYDGCMSDYAYYKGLGGPYLWCWWFGESYRSLVYYKKGDVEWGTPLVIVGLEEAKLSSDVKVYPNPVKDYLSVELKESALPAKIEIYNVMGSLLKEFVLMETNQQISLQQLTPGLYFYQIVNEKEALGSGKLVVE